MQSNFIFLEHEWSEIFKEAREVEQHVFVAPRTSVFYARRTMEMIVKWMFEYDPDLHQPYNNHLAALIHEPSFKQTLPHGLFHGVNYIRKIGNLAVHDRKNISQPEAIQTLRNLYNLSEWFSKQYSQQELDFPQYSENFLPRGDEVDKNAAQLRELQETLDQQTETLALKDSEIEALRTQIEQTKIQVKQTKEKNKARIPHKDYTEAETRELFIDLLLKEAGWDPKAHNVEEFEVTGMPNNQGIGYVDYVLWGDDGKPLALVEAKKTTKDAEVGRRQAELYASCLEATYGQRPVIFYSNGYDHWIWDDVAGYPPRPVLGFYTKDQLQTLINRRQTLKTLKTAAINLDIAGRHYQRIGITSVLDTFENKNRKALLVMATGTGKTRTAISLVDVLSKNNWAKNILFLADRTALLRQAKNAFKELLPNLTAVNIIHDKDDQTSRLVFSTYPTMMNLIDEAKSDGEKRFGVGHFDLIIIDEAHRSVYQKYRAIFEYFDSLLIGLTATPKADIDHNTYELFELEDHVPTYAYELEEAVKDEFLVPPKRQDVPTKFMTEGLTYDELSPEEQEQYEMSFEEDDGTIPERINASEFNDWVFNKSTIDEVLAYVMEKGIKVEGGDRLGKTIIFAKKHSHAMFIEERFNKNYPMYAGKGLRVIDNYSPYADSLIEEFAEDKPSAPFIAVSVDMLDTGIDIPEIVNLVFFKTVRSKAKFWQMIGRGTRLCPDLFGPGEDKKEFVIFDVCGNFEFFDVNPDGVTSANSKSLSQQIFEKRLDIAKLLQADEYQQDEKSKEIYQKLLHKMHDDVQILDGNSFSLRPHKRYIDTFSQRERWDVLSNNDVLDLKQHIAPYISLTAEDDEYARRFDLLMLHVQLHKIKPERKVNYLQLRLQTIAEGLSEKANIPAIQKQIDKIRQLRNENFLAAGSLSQIEDIRESLRDLIVLLEPQKRKAVYTDFKDEVLYPLAGEDSPQIKDQTMVNYRESIKRIIKQNDYLPVIQKIKTNQQLSNEDIADLERLLLTSSYNLKPEELRNTFKGNEFGEFIRSIVGVDKTIVNALFAEFINDKHLNTEQLHFINEVVNSISENGFLDPGDLYEQPYKDYHFEGVDGLFRNNKEKILNILTNIKKTAQFGLSQN